MTLKVLSRKNMMKSCKKGNTVKKCYKYYSKIQCQWAILTLQKISKIYYMSKNAKLIINKKVINQMRRINTENLQNQEVC